MRQFLEKQNMIVDARKTIQNVRYVLIKNRAIKVCVALQDLGLYANRYSYIVLKACVRIGFLLYLKFGSQGQKFQKMIVKKTLYEAVEQGDFDLTAKLIEQGDDVNALSSFDPYCFMHSRKSVLHATFQHKTAKMMQYLIDCGANVHYVFSDEIYQITNGTVLAHAVMAGLDASLIKCLLHAKADPNQIVKAHYYFNDKLVHLLVVAIAFHQWKSAILLVQAGANVDCQLKNELGLLHNAVYIADDELLEFLLALGADVDKLAIEDNEYFIDPEWRREEKIRIHCMLLAYNACCSDKNDAKTALDISCKMLRRSVPAWKQKSVQDISNILQETGQVEQARRAVQIKCFSIIKDRAVEVCIAMQDLGLDANRISYIVIEACAPFSYNLDFHYIWNLVVKVKHFW